MFEWYMDLINETLGFIDDSFYRLEVWMKKISRRWKCVNGEHKN